MLSETAWGLRGLTALFESSLQYKGFSAEEIAHKERVEVGANVAVNNTITNVFYGQYRPGVRGYPAQISYSSGFRGANYRILRSVVIFHELGHHFLLKADKKLFIPIGEAKEHWAEDWEIETWCESFVVTMLFQDKGHQLLTKETYAAFLAHGPRRLREEKGEYVPSLRNLFLGNRIVRHARVFAPRCLARLELMCAGNSLRIQAYRQRAILEKSSSA